MPNPVDQEKNMKNKNIFVTRPFLPPLEEYKKYIDIIWNNRYLTNGGPLVEQLEDKLKEYLGVKHVFFVSNGTVAIQLAIKALGIKKSIITTPFTFAATTNAILAENCKPVFADIDPLSFCIDPNKIEQLITPDTQAILGVHIYGVPCDISKISKIAKKHNIKVIYDGAHAFGSKIDHKSVLSFGDVSTVSFHATKLFNTGEGGAVITNDDKIAVKLDQLRNFGYEGDDILCAGINAKNTELHAALGLSNLPHMKKIISMRKKIVDFYEKSFQTPEIHTLYLPQNVFHNFAYFPVLFKSEYIMHQVRLNLKKENIFARRYFYPSLNLLQYLDYMPCPVSESISKRILCLPLYPDLPKKIVQKITNIIIKTVSDAVSSVGYSGGAELKNIK